MQLSDDLKLIAWPTRVRFDEDDNTPERLAFELEVNGERMVMLSLEQMLDALWSLEEAKLVAPLGTTWWSKAELNKQWGKPVVTVSSESRLERLDMKFAAEHAKKATKATTSPSFLEMSEDETGAPYLLLEQTLLQCVYIAEQLGAIPALDEKWLARVIPPSLRQLSQIQKSTGLH
ncbi:hypothetical protein BVY11_17180 [Pseudomonas amygdali pv. morsprunorum]|uniref:Uncharacterized protein n=4 Tax=Pseudomonas syringae group TaxID=136849 RepID=A0A0P9TIG9_PSEA0|nr:MULTISPECIES: hypothetical protein [Pseudomonas syringae group]KWT05023.1 hypothetical protein AL047_23790 [Pseudomonas syringae pv. broussonetiae]PPS26016.1 hypothetical protein BVY12_28435 [Pseudomonas amygdali pv. morsprunorum]KAA8700718.1 hypothetical protein F4W70_25745 [Pseudomonas cannabina]KPX65214.1 Uncharacterized protein ALO53_03059 [Pseudomonas amygdali pv. photiniae]PPS28648.1 hypothetical protein BVY11_17180 [Pseudomonas amygdali pv. morsprunorum]